MIMSDWMILYNNMNDNISLPKQKSMKLWRKKNPLQSVDKINFF